MLKGEPREALRGSSTEARGEADMDNINNKTVDIKSVIKEVNLLILEDKVAQAAVLLFEINKQNNREWFPLKFALLKSAEGHSELFLIASLINVAEADKLSQSFHLVPGLYALSAQTNENP